MKKGGRKTRRSDYRRASRRPCKIFEIISLRYLIPVSMPHVGILGGNNLLNGLV